MKMTSSLIDLISKKKNQKNKQIARVAYFFFGRCTATWLPNFLGWVDYHISLPMGLRTRAKRRALSSGGEGGGGGKSPVILAWFCPSFRGWFWPTLYFLCETSTWHLDSKGERLLKGTNRFLYLSIFYQPIISTADPLESRAFFRFLRPAFRHNGKPGKHDNYHPPNFII